MMYRILSIQIKIGKVDICDYYLLDVFGVIRKINIGPQKIYTMYTLLLKNIESECRTIHMCTVFNISRTG